MGMATLPLYVTEEEVDDDCPYLEGTDVSWPNMDASSVGCNSWPTALGTNSGLIRGPLART